MVICVKQKQYFIKRYKIVLGLRLVRDLYFLLSAYESCMLIYEFLYAYICQVQKFWFYVN